MIMLTGAATGGLGGAGGVLTLAMGGAAAFLAPGATGIIATLAVEGVGAAAAAPAPLTRLFNIAGAGGGAATLPVGRA